MKPHFNFTLVFFFLGLQISEAQTVPIISYPTPNTFTKEQPIISLTPINTGGAISTQAVVTTLAGSGIAGDTDGIGTAASFSYPGGLTIDVSGNIYVASGYNHTIRKISPAGVVTTFAGSGIIGFADGTGINASFRYPTGVALDALGNLYIADSGNHKIRKITPLGVVTTFAGSGNIGDTDGIGTAADFSYPFQIAIDAYGNMYVTDRFKIRKITPSGVVSTLAGSGVAGNTDGLGTAASFNGPSGIALDVLGNIYVAELNNHKIRKITPAGLVTTFAGSGVAGNADGVGTAASFNLPYGVAVDVSGSVFVADALNHKIRKISSSGVVSTLAGSGVIGSNDGIGTAASFYAPQGLAVDTSGHLYVSEVGNQKIRKITYGFYSISPALPAGLTFDTVSGVISGTPTIITPTTIYTVTAANPSGSSSFDITITVKDIAPIISYPTPNIFTKGQSITSINPISTGGNIISYAVNQTLPAGLTFDTTTGVISGTPAIAAPTAIYTVTASNAEGINSFDISITINEPLEPDNDNDGVSDNKDNCPAIYNPDQIDVNNNSIGDACDTAELFISNSFSPNGDGKNETWMISNIEKYTNNDVRVFNRWGQEVYFSEDYKNDWDGNGLPESIYYYVVKLNGGDTNKEYKGWLYIIK